MSLKIHPARILSGFILVMLTITLFSGREIKPTVHNRTGYLYQGYFQILEITVEQLDQLPGVSTKQAWEIFKKRDQFHSISDLTVIKGIGPKKAAKLGQYLRF